MSHRRSLKLPITLGIVMILLILALAVGWILLAVFGAINSEIKPFYWTLLSVGPTLFIVVLVGVVIYLSLSIKAINLTRRQSNFMDSITHELKSPIASLKLYLQTLDRLKLSAEERTQFHQYMMDDVRRLDDLITHLLGAAQLDQPVAKEEIESIELSEVLDVCRDAVCSRYRVPHQSIRLEGVSSTLAARRVDLEMIFRNLLDNAVKYAESEPEVVVTTRLNETHVIVQVADNGPGIPLNQRRKIFGRFVRLGLELVRKKPGTGLGLYIVRTLVRRMKGMIHVHDQPHGTGTVFEVHLPRTPQEAAGRPVSQTTRSADQSSDRLVSGAEQQLPSS